MADMAALPSARVSRVLLREATKEREICQGRNMYIYIYIHTYLAVHISTQTYVYIYIYHSINRYYIIYIYIYRRSQIDGTGKSQFVCHQYGKNLFKTKRFFATLRWHRGVCDTSCSCRQNHKSHLDGIYRL